MKITEDNFTITTIYFDDQFWCALIERCEDGKTYAGRHVFGAEPSNPEILNWMVYGFANVPLLPVEGRTKIRFKKLAKTEQKNVGGIPKSLTAFSGITTRNFWRVVNKKLYRIMDEVNQDRKDCD